MLINEVDAIPQRNRHNLSDSKKGRGSAQTDAATRLYTLKVGSINSIFYFLHKAAEPFNCLEQDNLA